MALPRKMPRLTVTPATKARVLQMVATRRYGLTEDQVVQRLLLLADKINEALESPTGLDSTCDASRI